MQAIPLILFISYSKVMTTFNFINTLDLTSFSFLVFVSGGFLLFLLCNNFFRKYTVFLLNLVFMVNLLSPAAFSLYLPLSLFVYLLGYRIAQNIHYKRFYLYSGIFILIFLFVLLRIDFCRSAVVNLLNIENYIPHTFGIVYGYSYFMFKSINYLILSYQGQISNYSLINYLNFQFIKLREVGVDLFSERHHNLGVISFCRFIDSGLIVNEQAARGKMCSEEIAGE